MISSLREYFYTLEARILDRLVQLRRDSVVIASTNFQGGESTLVYKSDDTWWVGSVAGPYMIHNPLLDKLLEKYALITDAEFQQKVGVASLDNWECERMRLRELEKMLKKNRDILLVKFVEEMENALTYLKVAG